MSTNIRFGKFLGRGVERFCYENLDNPSTCLKVSKKNFCKQTKREVAYFHFLEKKNIRPSFMPKFVALHETEDSYVLEQEYFRTTGTTQVLTIQKYVSLATSEGLKVLDKLLDDVKNEMIRFNIIVCDLRTTNFLVLVEKDIPKRVVIIDGYGSPEFIPLPNWISFLGKLKIERHWKKLMRFYNIDKSRRGACPQSN